MLVGILSDTHGRAGAMRAAVQRLQSRGAEQFLHCGDVGTTEVLDALAGLHAAFVFGNTDWNRAGLQSHAEHLGIVCFGDFGEFQLDGKSFALLHGDDAALKRRLLDEQRHDYLLQGHTHKALDTSIGKTRLINPGALHRAAQKTVVLLDTRKDTVEFLKIA